MLSLERLEDRLLPDALLAAVFQQQAIPVLEMQNAAAVSATVAVAQRLLPLATAQAAAVNTPGTYAALANLYSATAALSSAALAEITSFPAALASDEALLMLLPTSPNELALVDVLMAQLNQLGPMLQAAEAAWLGSI